ncbi:MAG TPA: SAF domain-containing protein, partial [Nitrospirota bacterium]
MKKYKPVIFIALTVLVALTTSLLTYKWFKDRSLANGGRGELVQVAVAVSDLSWGTVIKPEMVKTVSFLKGSLTSGFFTDAASVAGRVV